MASGCISSPAAAFVSGTNHLKFHPNSSIVIHKTPPPPTLSLLKNSIIIPQRRLLPTPHPRYSTTVHATYNDRRGGGGGDFVAGFLLGGAVFGALAYVFAPQIRRSLLNEDEYGFRRAKRPIYYDEGLEKTRQTLNEKINQLNSAIDIVSSRLRGGNSSVPPVVPIEGDPEEASM